MAGSQLSCLNCQNAYVTKMRILNKEKDM